MGGFQIQTGHKELTKTHSKMLIDFKRFNLFLSFQDKNEGIYECYFLQCMLPLKYKIENIKPIH